MGLNIHQVEDAINEVLGTMPEPEILPVIGPNRQKIAEDFRRIDFYALFNQQNHPEIYEGLRKKVILMIRGTHVRIFETIQEVRNFMKGLKSPMCLIPGPPEDGLTLDELNGG